MNSKTFYKDICQTIFEASVEGVLVVRKDGSILMANPACEQIFDYNSEELLNKNIDILIPEKLKQQHNKHISSYFKNPKARAINKDIDLWGIKKDGTKFSLDISLSPTLFEGENVTIAFLRDASIRKNHFEEIQLSNLALIESNRKFDALINNLQGIVYRCKNDRDWTMEYISEGCQQITGYSPEAFLNGTVHFSDITLQEDQEKVRCDKQKGIDNKKPFSLTFRIKAKNGIIKYMQEMGQGIFDKNGNLEAIEGFISDVTSQKVTELNLKANEAKMSALLEAMPDMMFIQDRNGTYIDSYAKSPENLIIPQEKFIGKNMKDVLPAHIYNKIEVSHKDVIASGTMQIAEYSIIIQETIKHFEARVVLMNDHMLLTIVRDITEEREKEKQLNIKNNALASASNSIIIADAEQPNVPIIYCNTAFEKITGYTKEEVYGKNCNFLQGDDRDQIEIDALKNAISNGEVCHVVLRNYKKDGTLFWNDVTITPVHNKKNELTHFISVQNDVSTRIKGEHLKNKIRQILELISYDKPIKQIGNKIIETIETHIKGGMASILLLDKETKTLHKLVAPHLPKTFSDFIEGVTIGPKVGSCGSAAFLKKEVIVADVESNSHWGDYKKTALKDGLRSCWSYPIISSTKQVLGTFDIYTKSPREPLDIEKNIILDMTFLVSIAIEKHYNTISLTESKKQLEQYNQKLEEKVKVRTEEVMSMVKKLVESNLDLEDQILITKQAEKNALESKVLSSTIAKNFPNGFIAVMNKDLQLILAEGEALAKLGLKSLLFEGMSVDDVSVFAEERKTRIKEDVERTLSGEHLSFEIAYKNKYFSVNTAPLFDEDNQINSALMVYNDISQQKEIEFSIKNALKEEKELNELKSRFISMASHEFRTPLSAILTSAILIGRQNEPGKELKREKYVVQIEKNVQHLATILNDFLSLSKLEDGKIVAIKERFDIIYFSKDIIDQSKVGLKKAQNIKLNTHVDELFVYLDSKLLRHVITNLLSNASKYSKENTSIDFKISQNHDKVLIQITDQGIGIPEEEQNYLFDRFFRANNATNIEGTGLGLNIAKHYANLMGGIIGYESKLNIGTTFWVELPIQN